MEYFGRCYEICSTLGNAAALYSARVQYGIAKAHQFMGGFSSMLTDSAQAPEKLCQLVVWKDARVVSQDSEEKQVVTDEGNDKAVVGDTDNSLLADLQQESPT